MSVFVNRGNGLFSRRSSNFGWATSTSAGVGLGSEVVAMGDLNRDRKLDVVEAKWDEVSVFVNSPGLCTVPWVGWVKLRAARRLIAGEALQGREDNVAQGRRPGLGLRPEARPGNGAPEGRQGEPRRQCGRQVVNKLLAVAGSAGLAGSLALGGSLAMRWTTSFIR